MQHVAILIRDTERAGALEGALRQAGLAPLVCRNPDELYEVVNGQSVDALILEDRLSGFFRGTELIDRLNKELLQPKTLLLAEGPRELKERAAALGINDVLPPNEDPVRICETMQGMLVSASQLGMPLPLAARQIATRTEGIRPIPQLLVRLSGYLADEQAPLAQLAADISTDPCLTADLLRLTNSPALGTRTRITRVLDAVSHLGIRRTVALAFSAAVRASQSAALRRLPGEFQEWFHFRNVLIANVAGTFAGKITPSLAETAYVLGLMQELGMLVMLSELGGSYQKLLSRCRSLGQLHLPHLETQEYGFTHAEVSAALLLKWRLPPAMTRIVALHHQGPDTKLSEAERVLLGAAQIADAFADFRDLPCPQRHDRFARSVASLGDMSADVSRNCIAQAIGKTLESAEILSTSIPSDFEPERIAEVLRDGGTQKAPGAFDELLSSDGAVSRSERDNSGSPKILVVDDESDYCRVLERLLSGLGFQVEAVNDVEGALRSADGCDAILCDVHLPVRNGIELMRELRSRGYSRPVLMMSGDCRRNTVLDAIRAGAADYIPKPFSRTTLAEKLQRAGLQPGPGIPPRPTSGIHANPILAPSTRRAREDAVH